MTPQDTGPEDVTRFWLDAGPDAWYKQDAAFDQTIRDRFGPAWDMAAAGALRDWATGPQGALGYIILTDQFPRNMFRDEARAFETDDRAKEVACYAIDREWDLRIPEPARQFFYLPFMHSERLSDQDHGVRLIKARMETGNNLLHARAHREIIRKFGRFPYRNAALGRVTTPEEQAFLDNGGYGGVVRALEGD